MQTTLLGIAIAFILALLAALVGPYFINWNDHRARFEAEASRMVGLQVRVTGPIEVSVLPTPAIRLGGIELGPTGEASRLRARSLGIELQLGSLMRGEIRAAELRVIGPEFALGINSLGQVDWPAMSMTAGDGVSIDNLTVEDGRAVLSDIQSQSRLVLDNLHFKGDLRSLSGPARGEGGFVTRGTRHTYRLNMGRVADEGVRIRLALDTPERPFPIDIDGTLAFERAVPRYEGQITASRPAAAVLAGGVATVAEPLRITSKINWRAGAAVFDQVEVQYGPEEKTINLTGAAQLRLGEQPRLQAALTARQVDLDRLVTGKQGAGPRTPLAAVQSFAELFGAALTPPVPLSLTLGIDQLTVAGAPLQSLGADLRVEGEGWQLDRLEFRAPGFTQVKLSGRVDSRQGLGFNGAASVEANDPRSLLAWLTGSPAGPVQIRPWQIRGEVAVNAESIAIERLKTDIERGTLEGRLAYFWPTATRPARLDADLKAGEIDIDALQNFADAAFSGSGIEAPREVALALVAERARFAGFDARKAAARLRFDAEGIAIDQFSVADFGNATIEASGRIETGERAGGSLKLDLDARDTAGVLALVERFAPAFADEARALAGRQRTAKLRALVSLTRPAPARATGKIEVSGRMGAIGLELASTVQGTPNNFSLTDPAAMRSAELSLTGKLDTDNGAALLSLLGLDRIAGTATAPGRLTIQLDGPIGGALRMDTRLIAGPMDATAQGIARLGGGKPGTLEFAQVAGTLASRKAQGKMTVTLSEPLRFDGEVDVDFVDVPGAVATLVGMRTGGKAWSAEPFARSSSDASGRIAFRAPRAQLANGMPARDLRGVANLGVAQLVFEDLSADTSGGRWSGRLALTHGAEGLSARARLGLTGIDAAAIVPADGGPPPLTGRVTLNAELEGGGLSPAAFIGSLSGQGTLVLEQARIANFNPRAFDALTRASDLGVATDGTRVRDFMASALRNGTLTVERATADLAIAGGQVRLTNVAVRAPGADVTLGGTYNLADGSIDATVNMTGSATVGTMRPAVFVSLRGPAAAPARSIDAAALTGWLALRSVEQQSKRLEEMERAREEQRLREEAKAKEAAAERERRALAPSITPDEPGSRSEDPTPSSDVPASGMGTTDEPPADAVGPDVAPPLPPAVVIPALPAPRRDSQAAPRTTPMPRPPNPAAPLNLIGPQN